MNTPRVSIVIPVYNGADYLREAIDSALAQTYRNVEVIVVNDGSVDGRRTEEIALSYGTALRYFAKSNGGVASALNLGIKEMSGEYFSWLSHDDVYYPDKIAKQIELLRDGGMRDRIVYSDFDCIDCHSKNVGMITVQEVPPGQMRYALTVSYPIHGCTTLIPRRCFVECGLFDEKLRTTQDYDMWFRLASHFEYVHLSEGLIQSRVHDGQGTNTMRPLHLLEVNRLLGEFVESLGDEEVVAATLLPAPLAFMSIAESFQQRKLRSALFMAWRRGVRSLAREGMGCAAAIVGKTLLILLKEMYRLQSSIWRPVQ